ncbi:MAG: hypothetical protein IKL05_01650 [Clostridia bacterium]|nr:hypothetical protein [Clostridia bacterium]
MDRGCVFSYLITEDKVVIPELSVEKEFGKYTISMDHNTPFEYASNGVVECAIYGLVTNVVSNKSNNIVDEIVEKCKKIQDVVEYEKNLGGKYILLFKVNDQYYIQGDATCSIPIFYNTEGAFVCSSNCNYIAKLKDYCVDNELNLIRKSGDISQAMPYDITPYRQIKQLIPNHFLDVNKQSAIRFVNSIKRQKAISVEKATKIVLPMIENLLNFYMSKYKIYCPITSGRDSRVVLSFLLKSTEKFSCYTIKHPEHNNDTQDITVPIAMCKKVNIEHRLIEDVIVSETLKDEIDRLLGNGNYSLRTLRIAQTIKEFFGDGAIINGDIIGQVGKCSLHRDIPSIFATPSYFRCKLHNYSKESKMQLKQWIKEIKSSGEKTNVFDLFSIENRMGRWAAQENLIYNTLGQAYLNIFNCRSIIYTWTAVERKERKLSMLHVDLIQKNSAVLLDIPFETDESIVIKISKANGFTYLFSSYMKYYIEKAKFEKGRRI